MARNTAARTVIARMRGCLRAAVAAALTLVAVSAPLPAPADTRSHESLSPPGLMVGVVSHALHINCTGSGQPVVVFDAGLGGTSYDWVKVQPQVAQFTTACSYDRAGYGWSDSGPRPRTAGRAAEELKRLLVYASVRPPYLLVGHSLGGLNMRMFAHHNRAEVAGMVLVDATHERQFERLEAGVGARRIAPRRRAFVIANQWEVPDGMPPELRPLVQSLVLTPRAVRSLYHELYAMRRSAKEVRAANVRFPNVPVQVIIRAYDANADSKRRKRDRIWRQLQQELADTTPGGRLVIAPAAGHHVHLDSPQVIVDALRAMVAEVRGTT